MARYVLFGRSFCVHSMEFLKKNTKIKQLKNSIILSFSSPYSLTKCILCIITGANPLKPHIDFMISKARCIELLLKNTQVKLIKIKVEKTAVILLIWRLNFFQKRWITLAMPCNAPHTIKVKFAPCHIPPIKNVKNKFLYVSISPFLLPPSGIYM